MFTDARPIHVGRAGLQSNHAAYTHSNPVSDAAKVQNCSRTRESQPVVFNLLIHLNLELKSFSAPRLTCTN